MFSTDIETVFNSPDLFKALDIVSDNEGRTVSIIPFGSVYNMFERLLEKVVPNKTVTKIKEANSLSLFKLEAYDAKSGALRTSGRFILRKLDEYEFVYQIICLEESEFFHKQLRPFVKSFYKEVILSFIKSKELINLIESYQSANNLTQIKITRASQKIRYHDENSMSTVTWNNSSLEAAYDWLRENNGFFKSIQFKAYQFDREVSNTFFERSGIVRIEKNFIRLYDSLITPTNNQLNNYIKLFKNRGRRDNIGLGVRPLEIKFSEEVFSNVENHKKFIEIISKLKDSSVSVLHGNPYIHLSIIDYVDASSYDLWVVDSSKILLVPQLRSSIIGLKRIVNHIFDTYAEGEISNYEN